MGPDALCHCRVSAGKLHGDNPRLGCSGGDPQGAVAAVGAQLQCQPGTGPTDRGIEQLALLVADIDQKRLVVGVLIHRREGVADIAPARVCHHVVGRS